MTDFDIAAARRLQKPAKWAEAGIEDPSVARQWWTAGFDPEEAEQWLPIARACFEYESEPWRSDQTAFLQLASVFRASGFTPDEARRWAESVPTRRDEVVLGIPHEARRWRAAGFTPETAAAAAHPSDVDGFDTLELAVAFLNAGWNTESWTFLRLLSVRPHYGSDWETRCLAWLALDSPRTLDYVKAGLPPQGSAGFRGAKPSARRPRRRAPRQIRPSRTD